MKDIRSKAAKARDEFLESSQGKPLLQGTASGQYLRNRIVVAFLGGVEWGRNNPIKSKDSK